MLLILFSIQVMLINAVKDVASALGDLISATKTAAGKNVNDPAMGELKNSAKVMVTNVTSLLKTVKSVEDEATRGTRALEATIEAIVQEARVGQASNLLSECMYFYLFTILLLSLHSCAFKDFFTCFLQNLAW